MTKKKSYGESQGRATFSDPKTCVVPLREENGGGRVPLNVGPIWKTKRKVKFCVANRYNPNHSGLPAVCLKKELLGLLTTLLAEEGKGLKVEDGRGISTNLVSAGYRKEKEDLLGRPTPTFSGKEYKTGPQIKRSLADTCD